MVTGLQRDAENGQTCKNSIANNERLFRKLIFVQYFGAGAVCQAAFTRFSVAGRPKYDSFIGYCSGRIDIDGTAFFTRRVFHRPDSF